MVLTNHIRYFLAAFIALLSSSAHAGIMDFVSGIQKSVQKLYRLKIEPYIIPLEQGRLVEEKILEQLDIGLSREQVKYLLGKPTSVLSIMITGITTTITIQFEKIKNLYLVFKNEKVFEIVIDQKTFKKFGQTEKSQLEMSEASIIQINEK